MDETLLTDEIKKEVILNEKAPFPINVELQLTYKCNANCLMCDMNTRDKKEELALTKVLSLIDELKRMGTKMLILTGGEPFVRSDIFEIINYCNKNKILVSIHTNATLIDNYTIARLTGLKIHTINISLHHPSKKHDELNNLPGSFEKVVNAINLIKQNFTATHIKLRCVLSNVNYLDIINFESLYGKAKFDSLKFIFARPLKQTKNLGIFLNKQQKIIALAQIAKLKSSAPFIVKEPKQDFISPTKCLSSFFRSTITPNGNVIPSCYCEDTIMGNINQNSFEEIWLGDKAKKIRTSFCNDCQQSFNQELNKEYVKYYKNEVK